MSCSTYKLKLTIDIFPFYLYQKEMSEMTKVKQKILKMKSVKSEINKELSLTNCYFFNYWDVTMKKSIDKKRHGCDININLPLHSYQDLYHVIPAKFYQEDEISLSKRTSASITLMSKCQKQAEHIRENIDGPDVEEEKGMPGDEESNSNSDNDLFLNNETNSKPSPSCFNTGKDSQKRKRFIGITEMIKKSILAPNKSGKNKQCQVIISYSDTVSLETVYRPMSMHLTASTTDSHSQPPLYLYEVDLSLPAHLELQLYIPKIS